MRSNRCKSYWVGCAALALLLTITAGRAAQIAFDPGSIPGGIAVLLLSNPSNGQKNVPIDTPVVFTFFSAMKPVQVIEWSGNVTADKFSYSWSADGKTLTCTYQGGFPASSTITWTLDTNTFQDTTGSALLPINNSGAFTTGTGSGGGGGPCDGGSTNSGAGSVGLFKSVQYVQTSASAPTLDPDNGPTFGASVSSPKTETFSGATLQLPNGTTKPLTNIFGHLLLFDQFSTEQQLEAAYPPGSYVVVVQRASGNTSFNLTMAAAPPMPQISNFSTVLNFDPTADLTVQWLPFTGVAPLDGLSFEMIDGTTTFLAPDLCIPRPLANTATSILVPKNTFGAGTEIDGALTFTKLGTIDTNTISGVFATSGYSKRTNFKPHGGGGTPPPTQPEIKNLVRMADGTVKFQVSASIGANLLVEASQDLSDWTQIASGPATTGLFLVTDTAAAAMSHRFYRATAF